MHMWPVLALLLAAPAMAQQQRPAPPATPAQAPAAPEAERSTASFGDWTVRCERIPGPPPRRQCEMTQAVQAQQGGGQAQAVAQWAIGRLAPNEPFRFVAVLPVNVSFGMPVRVTAEGEPPLTLAFTRCVPVGCFAEVSLSADALRRLRARAAEASGRVEFRDSGDRELGLPVSFRGFAQALAALEGS